MRFLLMVVIAGILPVLAGCALLRPPQDPTRLYLLSVTEEIESEREAVMTPDIGSGITLGVQRVQIPPYLNAPSIAMLTRHNTVRYAVYDRWAESMDRGIARIVRGNLRQISLFSMVDLFPRRAGERYDFEVSLLVEACDAILPETDDDEGRYIFHVSWEVMGNDGRTRLAHGDFVEEGPWTVGDFSGFARSISLAGSRLSRHLAWEIEALASRGTSE